MQAPHVRSELLVGPLRRGGGPQHREMFENARFETPEYVNELPAPAHGVTTFVSV